MLRNGRPPPTRPDPVPRNCKRRRRESCPAVLTFRKRSASPPEESPGRASGSDRDRCSRFPAAAGCGRRQPAPRRRYPRHGCTLCSVRGLIATGARAGQRLRRALQDPATGVRTAPLCFGSRGFSLHAATRVAGPDRQGLERLYRYVARPALASERLRVLDSQRLSFALKTPWSEGTSHLLLSPMELLEKLAA